jgi:MYXO-CTERM domain-containing protein
MSEASTTALPVGTPDWFAQRASGITATVPRDEIEEALASEPPAELMLDVLRVGPGREGAETRTVNVAWTQADLESLLKLPGGDAVTFYFDPAELEPLLTEAEVEGHGLREAAVVLSIAAAAAVGAGQAAAQPDPGGAGQPQIVASGTHDEASLTDRGIALQAVASTHDEASLTARGIERAPAVHDEAGFASRGIEPGTLPATHDESGYVARGIESGTLPASHDEASLIARGIEEAPAVHDEAMLEARGIDAPPAVHDETTLVGRGIVEDTTVQVSDTGFEFPSVDAGTAAALTGVAGAGLLILGAAFATRRRELGHP